MKRILFVDDEPLVLDGLQRMLHPMRPEWDMVFAPSGEVALAELEAAPFDVVVADMRMPGMDGAALLTRVQQQFPKVVRIVLSAHTEFEAALRAVPVAHQFLTKPCEAEELREVVTRACNLQSLLGHETVRRIVSQIDTLPALPTVYAALSRALADPNAALTDIAQIVEQDVAMSAKVLHLVNSAFFGLPQSVTNITKAVSYLGTNMIKNLALSVEVFRTFRGDERLPGFSFEAQQRHALLTAGIAKRLTTDKLRSEDSFLAGMLHDIGKLVLATRLQSSFVEVLEAIKNDGCQMHEVEQRLTGITHAEIGAYLLGLWGLPYGIVEAVAYHHSPKRVGHKSFGVLDAVHVADLLAHEHAPLSPSGTAANSVEIDLEYLKALGSDGELSGWEAIAAEQAHMEASCDN